MRVSHSLFQVPQGVIKAEATRANNLLEGGEDEDEGEQVSVYTHRDTHTHSTIYCFVTYLRTHKAISPVQNLSLALPHLGPGAVSACVCRSDCTRFGWLTQCVC